eukprot:318524-Pleurochrysis_carterae.AAC.2
MDASPARAGRGLSHRGLDLDSQARRAVGGGSATSIHHHSGRPRHHQRAACSGAASGAHFARFREQGQPR